MGTLPQSTRTSIADCVTQLRRLEARFDKSAETTIRRYRAANPDLPESHLETVVHLATVPGEVTRHLVTAHQSLLDAADVLSLAEVAAVTRGARTDLDTLVQEYRVMTEEEPIDRYRTLLADVTGAFGILADAMFQVEDADE